MPNYPANPPNDIIITLTYFIYSRDPADTAALRAAYGLSVARRPAYMRDVLAINETDFGFQLDNAARVISFSSPPVAVDRSGGGTWVKNPIKGTIVYPPNPSFPGDPYWYPPISLLYDFDQDWFIIPAHASVPIWGPGVEAVVQWNGIFLSMGGTKALTPVDAPHRIIQRRWIDGFELPHGGDGITFATTPEGATGGLPEHYCRDASRTPDGIGAALRNITVGTVATHTLDSDTNIVWERFYIRLRRTPTVGAPVVFYKQFDNLSNNIIQLKINASAQIEIWAGIAGGLTLQATTAALSAGVWYRVDEVPIFTDMPAPPAMADHTELGYSLFLNGVSAANFSNLTTKASPGQLYHRSTLGGLAVANDLELDFDDWSNQKAIIQPLIPPLEFSTNRNDWKLGSHVQLVRNIAFGAGHDGTHWTGNYRNTQQNPVFAAQGALVSSAASARAELATLLDNDPDNTLLGTLRQMGAAAWAIGSASFRTGGTDTAQIGYKSAGGADVLQAASQSGALDGNVIVGNYVGDPFNPTSPLNIEPLLALFLSDAGGGVDTLRLLMTEAQYLGSWGPEDDSNHASAPGVTDMIGIHNGPYAMAFLGRTLSTPINSIGIFGATYVGNGTFQEIVVNLSAVHFVYIRHINGGGSLWWTSMLGSHNNFNSTALFTNAVVATIPNNDGTCTIQITGNENSSNANGDTYQIIAVCDIMSRMMINGAFRHVDSSGFNTNNLFDSTFTPLGMFIQRENLHATGGASGCYWKGPGNAATKACLLNGSETADVVDLGTGFVQSRATVQQSAECSVAFMALRQIDANSPNNYCAIGQYTGDGTASRDIPVALNGRRPMWAMVIPMNAQGTFRDPSHNAQKSSPCNNFGAQIVNRIIGGGINIITVGIDMNANGVVHSYVVFPGGTDACNDGWACNGTVGWGEPGWPPSGPLPPWIPPPAPPPGDIVVVGEGGITISGDPAITMLKDVSGIYEIIPGQTHDTVYDRQTGQTSLNVKIPDPFVKIPLVP